MKQTGARYIAAQQDRLQRRMTAVELANLELTHAFVSGRSRGTAKRVRVTR